MFSPLAHETTTISSPMIVSRINFELKRETISLLLLVLNNVLKA